MKMIYGGVPVNSLKVKHYEMNTNSATVQPSDLQAGITCFARGQKVTGTGRAFSFAMYGDFPMNTPFPVPTSEINTIIVSSDIYSIKMLMSMRELRDIDFATAQQVASVVVDEVEHPITLQITNNMLTISCSQTMTLQVMFGKDEYV